MLNSGPVVLPSATITAATLFAPMFQINWQSSDRSALGASPQTSPSASQPTDTGSAVPSRTKFPSGTQTATSSGTVTGGLVMASSSNTFVTESTLTASTSEAQTPTTAAASSGAAGNETGSGSSNDDQGDKTSTDRSGFPVAATVGASVAGGLGALAVTIWAVFMWHRRKQWNQSMLQISDERMLQLDSIYEEARPKTFDTAGRETTFGMHRQNTADSTADSDIMYGPGQETSRLFRPGPRRTPQLVGNFHGASTADLGNFEDHDPY